MRDFAKSRGKARKVDNTEEVEAAISVRYFFANRLTFRLDWKANMIDVRSPDCAESVDLSPMLPSPPFDNGML